MFVWLSGRGGWGEGEGEGGHSPDRLLGEVRTGEIDGVREEEYGRCRSRSIVEEEPTKWYWE